MLTIGALLLSSAWQATTAAGHIIPRGINDTLPQGNGTSGNDTYVPWVPSCKLPAIGYYADSAGFDYQGGCVASTGTLRGFMFFVDFPDAPVPEGKLPEGESPQELYDTLVPESAKWYAQSSYGALSLNITADTSGFYRMPATAESYHWLDGLNWSQHESYVQDAIDAFTHSNTRPPPPEVDVLYVVPTRRAARWLYRSQTSSISISSRQGVRVAKKATTFGADGDWDLNNRTMTHETGHAFCLPDYYPFGDGYNGEYVGGFSFMAQTLATAPDFFAWDKWRLGWLRDEAVDCVLDAGTTEHVLSPLADDPHTADGLTMTTKKAVVVAANVSAALVAEVRVARGLDAAACAPGVLLYTVATDVATGSGPVRVLDATPGSGGCVGLFEDKMDGTLSLSSRRGSQALGPAVSAYEVPGWGVKVTLTEVVDDRYTIRIDRQTSIST